MVSVLELFLAMVSVLERYMVPKGAPGASALCTEQDQNHYQYQYRYLGGVKSSTMGHCTLDQLLLEEGPHDCS